jgi:hypothetical protein
MREQKGVDVDISDYLDAYDDGRMFVANCALFFNSCRVFFFFFADRVCDRRSTTSRYADSVINENDFDSEDDSVR